jgi:hypothetical protein
MPTCSCGWNAYAFAAQASGNWHPYAAAVLGIAVAALIYPLTRRRGVVG